MGEFIFFDFIFLIIALPKRELKDTFGIELEDYYGEQVPVEIDTDRKASIIDIPLDE